MFQVEMRTLCIYNFRARRVNKGFKLLKDFASPEISMARKKGADSKRPRVMTPAGFKRWRKDLKLSQKEAAEALGLKRRILQYYEKGERDGERVEVPKTVRLACYAISQGCKDYSGPKDD